MDNPRDIQEQNELENRKKPSKALKVTVLVILVVLLVVGVLLPIKLIPNAFSSIASSISSIFTPNKPVTVTTDKTDVNSGDTFTISWNGSHKTNGTYSLTYDCTTGLRLVTSVNQPNETVPCGTTYYFSPNQNSIDVTVISEGTRFADAKITLGFLENGAATVDTLGSTSVTVTNTGLSDNLPATTTPSTGTSATTTTQPAKKLIPASSHPIVRSTRAVSNPNGLPDLEVRPISVGYLNDNGVFIPSGSVNPNQQAAIKFSIVNVGDKNTGAWTFAMDIPSQTDPRFTSGIQQNLGPGDRIEYVLGFRNIDNAQDNIATITADPSNFLMEYSKANNTARIHIVNNFASGSNTGNADLSVRVLDTGVVNRSTGVYTAQSSVGSSDRVGIRFVVTNSGTTPTGTWKFHATLPATDSRVASYDSDPEPSLNPGQSMTFSIVFETLQNYGSNTATITVDSANQVGESNENNNTTSVNIVRN